MLSCARYQAKTWFPMEAAARLICNYCRRSRLGGRIRLFKFMSLATCCASARDGVFHPRGPDTESHRWSIPVTGNLWAQCSFSSRLSCWERRVTPTRHKRRFVTVTAVKSRREIRSTWMGICRVGGPRHHRDYLMWPVAWILIWRLSRLDTVAHGPVHGQLNSADAMSILRCTHGA